MTYYVITRHPGEDFVTPFPDMQGAIDYLEGIGGWEDGKRFIAIPMIRTVQYHEPIPCKECGLDVRECSCVPF